MTNGSVTVTAKDSTSGVANLYVNGSSQGSNKTTITSSVSTAGSYSVYAVDKAGNTSATYTFTIDKTAPTVTLTGVSDGGYTNSNVTVKAADNTTFGFTLYVDNAAVSGSSKSVTEAGSHSVYATDKAGNKSSTYTFTIDKTAPTITLDGVADGGITSGSVKVTAADSGSSVTLVVDGNDKTNGYTEYSQGKHTAKATDKAGNSTTKTFTIDKTAPVITLSGVSGGGMTKGDVTITCADTYSTFTLYLAQDSSEAASISSGSKITEQGVYSCYAVDGVGNTSNTLTFTIDKTAPIITLSCNSVVIANNSKVNAKVKISVKDNYTKDGAVVFVVNDKTIDGSEYSVSDEAKYTVTATDSVGNVATATFEIDLTPPDGTLYGVTNGGITNSNVYFSWEEYGCYATLDGEAYEANTLITAESMHNIKLYDSVGNVAEYSFLIDKTAPVITLTDKSTKQILCDGQATKNNVYVEAVDSLSSFTIYDNDTLMSAPFTLTAEAKHVLRAVDSANNVSEVVVYIDKTPPTGSFSKSGNTDDKGVVYFNQSVAFTWTEENAVATLNGVSYTSGTLITAENSYSIILTDYLGNESSPYKFVIDLTPYTANYDKLQKSDNAASYIPTWFETYSYTDYGGYKVGKYYSFSNYSDCYLYAKEREESQIETGTYNGGSISSVYYNKVISNIDVSSTTSYIGSTYYIYKDSKDSSELKVYFNISTLNSAVQAYAQKSITQRYSSDSVKPATAFAPYDIFTDIEEQEVYTSTIYISSTDFKLTQPSESVTLTVNGLAYSYSDSLERGYPLLITETDFAGNAFSYVIVIDIDAPLFTATDLLGTEINFTPSTLSDYLNGSVKEAYVAQGILLSIADTNDDYAILTIKHNGVTERVINEPNTTKRYTINESGLWTVTATDRCGNSVTKNIYISLQEPSVTIIENLNDKQRLESFNATINKENEYVTISNLSVYLKTSDSDDFVLLSVDGDGTTITTSRLKYHFGMDGQYRFEVVDNFMRSVTTEYEFIGAAPVGNLYTKGWTPLTNNSLTNSYVFFTWTGANCEAYYTIDGSEEIPYTAQFQLTSAGTYVIYLRDEYGKENVYGFTIDNIAPTGKLYVDDNGERVRLTSGNSTNKVVYFVADDTDDEYTITYTVGDTDLWVEYSGGAFVEDGTYQIRIIDKASNMSTYSFTIDTIAPTFSLVTSSETFVGGTSLVNTSFYFTWSETGCTAILNNKSYTKNSTIYTEATYVFQLTDKCGNFALCYVKFDKTPPLGTLTGVIDGGYTNTDVTFTWEETGCTATLNGESYSMGTVITAENSYTLLLYDEALNCSKYTFIIDKTAPVGTLTGVANGGYTNSTVSFTWKETGCTATLNGESYTKNTSIYTAKFYTLVLTDRANNSTTYTFTIDKTAPMGTLTGVSNGGYTNGNVTFTWDDAEAAATLNGLAYENGTVIKSIGYFELILFDLANNRTTYTWTIDRTPPDGTLTGVSNGGRTNGTVSFSWSEAGCTATLNGESYTKNTGIYSENTYEIILTDRANNSTTYTFTIDKTAPVGTLTGVENGGATNGNVTFTWDESGLKAYIDGAEILSGTEFTADGYYEITLYDEVNNHSNYAFTIDKTAPVGTLTGVADGGYTNGDVSFTWSERNCYALLDGVAYNSGTSIKSEQAHVIELYDSVGNVSTYSWVTDKTAPVGTLTGVENGGATNVAVSFAWEDSEATATLNGDEYISGTDIDGDSEYTLILTDLANNSTTYTFVITHEYPIGKLIGVADGGYTNGDVSFTWADESCYATLDGEAYTKGATITSEQAHTILLYNAAGSVTTYTFTIDRVAPVGMIYIITDEFDVVEVDNGTYSQHNCYFTWSEAGAYAYVNGDEYEKGSILIEENTYCFTLIDLAGNAAEYWIVVDRTAPTGTLKGVRDGSITNKTVTLTWTDEATATLNGKAYTSGAAIDSEGQYTLVLTDLSLNTTTYTFSICHTAPVGILYGVENGGATNGAVTFEYQDNPNAMFTVNNVAVKLDGESYVYGTAITEAGEHVITLSYCGNVSTYTWTTDLTPPDGTLTGVSNGGYTNGNVTFSWSEAGCTATLDGEEYSKGSTIMRVGEHRIELSDSVGNVSEYAFTIKRTPPDGTLTGVANGGYTNGNVTFTWEEVGCYATLNGAEYTSGTAITAENSYRIELYDLASNVSVYTFAIERTPPTGTLKGVDNGGYTNGTVSFTWSETGCTATLNGESYTKNTNVYSENVYILILTSRSGTTSTYSWTIDKTAPMGTLIGVDDGGESNTDIAFTWTDAAATATVNGEAYSKESVLSAENVYTFVLTDLAGNTTTYKATVDKTAPVLTDVADGQKFNSSIKLTTESNRINIVVTYTPFGGTDDDRTVTTVNNNSTLSKDGTYVIVLTDVANNSTTYNVSIKSETPVVSVVTNDKTVVDKAGNKSDYNVNNAFTLTTDENTKITVNDNNYDGSQIVELGSYNVVCEDDYGNIVYFTIEYAEKAEIKTVTSTNSVAITVILCVVGVLAVGVVIVKLIISRMKRTHRLHR